MTQGKASKEETKQELIDNLIVHSQISFDNKSIIFDREWFYENVELKQEEIVE